MPGVLMWALPLSLLHACGGPPSHNNLVGQLVPNHVSTPSSCFQCGLSSTCHCGESVLPVIGSLGHFLGYSHWWEYYLVGSVGKGSLSSSCSVHFPADPLLHWSWYLSIPHYTDYCRFSSIMFPTLGGCFLDLSMVGLLATVISSSVQGNGSDFILFLGPPGKLLKLSEPSLTTLEALLTCMLYKF